MKKCILVFVLAMVLVILPGCSNSQSNDSMQSSAPLSGEEGKDYKGENQDDMNAKALDEKESNEAYRKGLSGNDSERIFGYIQSIYPKYTQEDFALWTKQYFDVTGDGENEAIYSSSYGDGNLKTAIVITEENESLRKISKYMELAKYENKPSMRDGFFIMTSKTGGSGIGEYYMSIYEYTGSELTQVASYIPTDSYFTSPGGAYETTASIEGTLKDFIITYTEKNLETEESTIVQKDRYQYNEGNMQLDQAFLSVDNTAKTFEHVYDGTNLAETMRYFDQNLYLFSDSKREQFAEGIMEAIDLQWEEMSDWESFVMLPAKYYNEDDCTYDISNLDERSKKILGDIKNDNWLNLVQVTWTTEGESADNGIKVMIPQYYTGILKKAVVASNLENEMSEFLTADIYFSSDYMDPEMVSQTEIVYPNIVVDNKEDADLLVKQNLWKATISIPLEIIGQ